MFQQHQSGLGQRHTPAIAEQKGLSQLHFQLAHMPTQQRLRDTQSGSSTRKTAQLGHPDKGFNLLKVHDFSRYICG
jgi:hypothetical protein